MSVTKIIGRTDDEQHGWSPPPVRPRGAAAAGSRSDIFTIPQRPAKDAGVASRLTSSSDRIAAREDIMDTPPAAPVRWRPHHRPRTRTDSAGTRRSTLVA